MSGEMGLMARQETMGFALNYMEDFYLRMTAVLCSSYLQRIKKRKAE